VKDTDVIMMYTNGFSDNVLEKDYKNCLEENLSQENGRIKSYSEAANCQVIAAYIQSQDGVHTPFAHEWKAKGIQKTGGREDDATVTVAQLFTQVDNVTMEKKDP